MIMLEPQRITIEDDGVFKDFIISKFPATAGREIISGYPLTSMPKIGDYKSNEELMFKLMAYVQVIPDNGSDPISLSTRQLIDNHVPSWEMLARVEMKMMEYNCSFFRNGRILNFLKDSVQKLPQFLTKILTDLSGQLSAKEKQL